MAEEFTATREQLKLKESPIPKEHCDIIDTLIQELPENQLLTFLGANRGEMLKKQGVRVTTSAAVAGLLETTIAVSGEQTVTRNWIAKQSTSWLAKLQLITESVPIVKDNVKTFWKHHVDKYFTGPEHSFFVSQQIQTPQFKEFSETSHVDASYVFTEDESQYLNQLHTAAHLSYRILHQLHDHGKLSQPDVLFESSDANQTESHYGGNKLRIRNDQNQFIYKTEFINQMRLYYWEIDKKQRPLAPDQKNRQILENAAICAQGLEPKLPIHKSIQAELASVGAVIGFHPDRPASWNSNQIHWGKHTRLALNFSPSESSDKRLLIQINPDHRLLNGGPAKDLLDTAIDQPIPSPDLSTSARLRSTLLKNPDITLIDKALREENLMKVINDHSLLTETANYLLGKERLLAPPPTLRLHFQTPLLPNRQPINHLLQKNGEITIKEKISPQQEDLLIYLQKQGNFTISDKSTKPDYFNYAIEKLTAKTIYLTPGTEVMLVMQRWLSQCGHIASMTVAENPANPELLYPLLAAYPLNELYQNQNEQLTLNPKAAAQSQLSLETEKLNARKDGATILTTLGTTVKPNSLIDIITGMGAKNLKGNPLLATDIAHQQHMAFFSYLNGNPDSQFQTVRGHAVDVGYEIIKKTTADINLTIDHNDPVGLIILTKILERAIQNKKLPPDVLVNPASIITQNNQDSPPHHPTPDHLSQLHKQRTEFKTQAHLHTALTIVDKNESAPDLKLDTERLAILTDLIVDIQYPAPQTDQPSQETTPRQRLQAEIIKAPLEVIGLSIAAIYQSPAKTRQLITALWDQGQTWFFQNNEAVHESMNEILKYPRIRTALEAEAKDWIQTSIQEAYQAINNSTKSSSKS